MVRTALLPAALLLLLAVAAAAAPAPAPSPFDDPCFEVVTNNLTACLDYVDPANKTAPPVNSDCCQGVGDFIARSPQCVCFLLKPDLADSLGLPLDRGKALNLPAQCRKKIPTGELEKCLGSGASPAAKRCFPAVAEQLIPCLDYVDPKGNKTAPPVRGDCCRGVNGFLGKHQDCLCALINADPAAYPIPLDRAKVLTLPRACNATLPSIKCDGDVTTEAPPNACLMPVVNNLAACANYVDPKITSNATATPNGDCCKGVRSFLSNETTCVCSIINAKPGDYPIEVDRAKALELATTTCSANTSRISQCFRDVTTEAPPNACLMPVVNNLAACANYVDPKITSNATATPNGDCCKGVRSFLSNETTCVCSIINAKPGDYPIEVDRAKALELATTTCSANTSRISQCFNAAGPATSSPSTPAKDKSSASFKAPSLAAAAVAVAVAAAFL
ncbi:uncharacterized protein LOC144708366 [Wolffia australiana]